MLCLKPIYYILETYIYMYINVYIIYIFILEAYIYIYLKPLSRYRYIYIYIKTYLKPIYIYTSNTQEAYQEVLAADAHHGGTRRCLQFQKDGENIKEKLPLPAGTKENEVKENEVPDENEVEAPTIPPTPLEGAFSVEVVQK